MQQEEYNKLVEQRKQEYKQDARRYITNNCEAIIKELKQDKYSLAYLQEKTSKIQTEIDILKKKFNKEMI